MVVFIPFESSSPAHHYCVCKWICSVSQTQSSRDSQWPSSGSYGLASVQLCAHRLGGAGDKDAWQLSLLLLLLL